MLLYSLLDMNCQESSINSQKFISTFNVYGTCNVIYLNVQYSVVLAHSIFICFFSWFSLFISYFFLNFAIGNSLSTGRTVFSRHIEESAFRLFLLRKLDTYKSNIGVRRKTLFLVCIRIPTIYGQAELLILLSVLQGVQPYAADKKMLAPLFFLYVPYISNLKTALYGPKVHYVIYLWHW